MSCFACHGELPVIEQGAAQVSVSVVRTPYGEDIIILNDMASIWKYSKGFDRARAQDSSNKRKDLGMSSCMILNCAGQRLNNHKELSLSCWKGNSSWAVKMGTCLHCCTMTVDVKWVNLSTTDPGKCFGKSRNTLCYIWPVCSYPLQQMWAALGSWSFANPYRTGDISCPSLTILSPPPLSPVSAHVISYQWMHLIPSQFDRWSSCMFSCHLWLLIKFVTWGCPAVQYQRWICQAAMGSEALCKWFLSAVARQTQCAIHPLFQPSNNVQVPFKATTLLQDCLIMLACTQWSKARRKYWHPCFHLISAFNCTVLIQMNVAIISLPALKCIAKPGWPPIEQNGAHVQHEYMTETYTITSEWVQQTWYFLP